MKNNRFLKGFLSFLSVSLTSFSLFSCSLSNLGGANPEIPDIPNIPDNPDVDNPNLPNLPDDKPDINKPNPDKPDVNKFDIKDFTIDNLDFLQSDWVFSLADYQIENKRKVNISTTPIYNPVDLLYEGIFEMTSHNPEICMTSGFYLIAKKLGQTTIDVTCGNISKKINVNIQEVPIRTYSIEEAFIDCVSKYGAIPEKPNPENNTYGFDLVLVETDAKRLATFYDGSNFITSYMLSGLEKLKRGDNVKVISQLVNYYGTLELSGGTYFMSQNNLSIPKDYFKMTDVYMSDLDINVDKYFNQSLTDFRFVYNPISCEIPLIKSSTGELKYLDYTFNLTNPPLEITDLSADSKIVVKGAIYSYHRINKFYRLINTETIIL